jgi:protoporphyrin/coproporphyrin ferrochelatase
MLKYLGTTAPGPGGYRHDSPGRLGVLVANLGTPDSPNPKDVRRFLAQFLWDPRVIEMSRPLWWMLLHGVILRVRPRRSAHAYAQVWTPEGSPLLLYSRQLADALSARLTGTLGDDVPVALGMTYGNPSIEQALVSLHAANVWRLIVLPLYPQYSGSTTGSVFDQVTRSLARWRWVPEVRFVGQYHDESAYVEAIAASILEHWRTHGAKHLVFSFHGLPHRYLLSGDPYFCQCHKTARLVAASLGLKEGEWTVSFQSRVGREAWLKPYTDEVLADFASGSHRRVTVVCPGFATDCLETLEEIVLRNRADFLTRGGEAFDYVPALNASAGHVEALAGLLLRHAQGWPEASPGRDREELERDAALTADRARSMGAAS